MEKACGSSKNKSNFGIAAAPAREQLGLSLQCYCKYVTVETFRLLTWTLLSDVRRSILSRNVCGFQTVQPCCGVHPASCPWGKGSEREADRLTPSTGGVRNEYSNPYTAVLCLSGVDRENVSVYP